MKLDLPELEHSGYYAHDSKKKRIVDYIDSKLNLRLPSVLTYDSGPLTGGGKDEMHASLIVGRRFNPETGRCDYLLRDSKGPTCGYYVDPKRCEEGNVWITREQLHQWSVQAVSFAK